MPATLRLVTDSERITPTQAAASLRAAIKAAVKSGALPVAIYRVRTRYASLMSAIDVTVTDLPFCAWDVEDVVSGRFAGRDRAIVLTRKASTVHVEICRMARAAGYSADGRHSFLDVQIDHEERDGLFVFVAAERDGEIARATVA